MAYPALGPNYTATIAQPHLLSAASTAPGCGSDSVSRPAVSPDAGSPPAAATHSAFSSVTPVSVAAGVAAGGGGGGSLQTPSPPGLVLGAYPRVPGITDNLYNTAYAAQGYMPFGADPAAFYSPIMTGDQADALRSLSQTSLAGYNPYDPSAAMASYPYAGYGQMNLYAGTNRKNVTRETTNTLKAWLREHIKNPYPTKGEKIMLAIITKMTLTQVSTWFANARRRLKKEGKQTWTPRDGENRDDDDDDDDEKIHKDDEEELDVDGGDDDDLLGPKNAELSPCSSTGTGTCPTTTSNGALSPCAKTADSDRPATASCSSPTETDKPRIWSLADIATSISPPKASPAASPAAAAAMSSLARGAPYAPLMNTFRPPPYNITRPALQARSWPPAPPSV